ncbi:MAG: hypothetical protein COA55_01290, partial [Alcanivorax sp.]
MFVQRCRFIASWNVTSEPAGRRDWKRREGRNGEHHPAPVVYIIGRSAWTFTSFRSLSKAS